MGNIAIFDRTIAFPRVPLYINIIRKCRLPPPPDNVIWLRPWFDHLVIHIITYVNAEYVKCLKVIKDYFNFFYVSYE